MSKIYFSSDHHFNHANILKFEANGSFLRPGFKDVEQMNEQMITEHNAVVTPQDKWYCLGDIGFNRNALDNILPRMNGKKRLILGNHDQFRMSFYEKYFQKIVVSWRPFRSIIFTHYPILLGTNEVRIRANVHGHIHYGQINDPRYLSICVEETAYKPLSFEQIIDRLAERGTDVRADYEYHLKHGGKRES